MIPGLDGLRAIAFLLVFALHSDYLQIGWVGVQIFFVLSGFLITGILLDMKKKFSSKDYFLKFYGRRFLRIFPLYYFYLIIMGILATWLITIQYRPYYMNLFNEQVRYAALYVHNFFSTTIYYTHFEGLDHFWSLSVEEQFYIFWPLLIFATPEKFQKKLFLAGIILGPIFRVAFYFIHTYGGFRIFRPDVAEVIYALPFTHIDAFAFGAYISRYPIPKARQQFYFLLCFIPIIGFMTQYFSTGELGNISTIGYPLHMPEGYQYIWGYSLLNYFFAIIIHVVVEYGMGNRFLEWRPLRYLGKISYGLYVYHLFIIWFAFRIQDVPILHLDWKTTKPIATIISFFGTLFISSFSFHFIEKPLLNLKDRYFPLQPK